jgi:anti-sigma factor RsiW
MDCAEVLLIVAGERDEDLTLAESDAFEAHIDGCASCREGVARAEEDLERLSSLADPPLVAASAWARVDAAIRALPARVVPPAVPVVRPVAASGLGYRRPILAYAACGAALLLGSAFFAGEVPTRPRDTSHVVIGPVNPPGEDDIKVEDMKAGPSYKVLKKQGVLIVTPQGD